MHNISYTTCTMHSKNMHSTLYAYSVCPTYMYTYDNTPFSQFVDPDSYSRVQHSLCRPTTCQHVNTLSVYRVSRITWSTRDEFRSMTTAVSFKRIHYALLFGHGLDTVSDAFGDDSTRYRMRPAPSQQNIVHGQSVRDRIDISLIQIHVHPLIHTQVPLRRLCSAGL